MLVDYIIEGAFIVPAVVTAVGSLETAIEVVFHCTSLEMFRAVETVHLHVLAAMKAVAGVGRILVQVLV